MRNLYCKSIRQSRGRFLPVVMLAILILSAGAGSAFAQQDKKRITGIVTDPDGSPLTGATVAIQNTNIATTTNANGLFVLDTHADDVLVFRYTGFLEQSVAIDGKDEVNVTLQQDTQMFEEIVVVGYGKQKRAAMVSSISTVGSKELIAPTSNLTANLSGQLAGLISVQRTAEPGRDDAEFWIRGISSYAGGTSPLVLVDGVPRDINNIEADEIDSFSILKDASATAVYGAEGANGVILVTTKRGVIAKPRISFRAEYSIAQPQRLPEFVDSWTFLDVANEAHFNDGQNPYMDAAKIENYRNRVDNDLYPNSNWMDMLLANTVQNQRYTVGMRGGAENAKYFVSLAFFDQDGVFKSNPMGLYNSDFGFQRYNLRANVDLKVSKTTNLSIDLSGQYINRLTANRSADHIFQFMLFTPPHLFPAIYSDGTLATYAQQSDSQNRNPFNMLYNQGYRKEWGTKIQSTVNLDQDLSFITTGLKANGKVSFDYDSTTATLREYRPQLYHATGRDSEGNLIYNAVITNPLPQMQDPVFTANEYKRKIYIEASLNYSRNFGRHDVGAMLLYMQKEEQRHNPVLPIRKQGLVGRATYSFGNRYFIEGNFGYTGSYQFAEGHRFGFFPAVGVSYYVSNEAFYPDALKRVMNSAKLRVSIGRTGNDQVVRDADLTSDDMFIFRPTFTTSGYSFYRGIGTSALSSLGAGVRDLRPENLALRWEIEVKRNIGVDLAFFDNRVEFTADYFNNRRSSILIRRNTIPAVGGFHALPYENFGIVDNWGVDASLAMHHNFGEVKVSARGTFTFARNKIIERDEIPQDDAYQAETGRRINDQFLYIAERLYTPDDFIETPNPSGNGTYLYELKPGLPTVALQGILGPGDIKFADMNGDGVINEFDRVRGVGYPYDPEINYGFGFNVEWKGFYASVFFQGVGNSSIRLNQRGSNANGINTTNFWATSPFSYYADKANYRTAFLDRWSADDPYNQNVLMPRLHYHYSADVNKENNTWWLKSGNFLRLKNVEIGYTLPKRVSEKIRMENVRVYLLGYNLHVWDKLKMWDPELGNRNVAGMSYPMSRTFTLGLDVNF